MADLTLAELERRLGQLSPGDRSVLERAASIPDSTIVTSPGSPNDALCSEMVTAGWAKTENPFGESPQAAQMANLIRAFVLTSEGAEAVRAAFANLKRNKR